MKTRKRRREEREKEVGACSSLRWVGERQNRGFGRDPAFAPELLSHCPGASSYTPPSNIFYTHTLLSVCITAKKSHN